MRLFDIEDLLIRLGSKEEITVSRDQIMALIRAWEDLQDLREEQQHREGE
jgi:hypothetical protein